MDPKFSRAVDELEIRQLLARYCRGIDRLDEDMVVSCFSQGAAGAGAVSCGTFKGTPKDWVDYVFPLMRKDLLTIHQLSQMLIVIEGDQAQAESYFADRHAYDDNGGVTVMTVFGRYVDKLEKQAGIWKIARRTVVLDLRQTLVAPAEQRPGPAAARRADDPSFELAWLSR